MEARYDRALAGGHRSFGPGTGAPAEPAGAPGPQNRAVEMPPGGPFPRPFGRGDVGARGGGGGVFVPQPRRALLFVALVTACDQPSPAGPAAEPNPATFDVATSEPGSPLPFLTLNQRALFER